jgi:hypothetical protein
MSDTKGGDMTVNRSFVAVVALVAAIATSAVGAGTRAGSALAGPTATSPFVLTLEYQFSGWEHSIFEHEGTFAARAPFCRSGTFVPLADWNVVDAKYRFTCDDGSGSLVVSASTGPGDHYPGQPPVVQGSFRILEGTGSYAGLRGKGSQASEILSERIDPDCIPFEPDVFGDESCLIPIWRSTLEGVAGEDAVAPAIGFSSVDVKRLPRPAGAYSLDVAIALRDDVEGNPVSYLLRVTPTTSARELARSFGTTQDGAASVTMRVRYYKPPKRAVLLRLSASDEVGNESSINRVLRLPR